MSVLSDAQFADQVNGGGSSRRLINRSQAPASGYYVSTPKFEEKHDRPVTASDVGQHRDRVMADRSSGYQGGWNDNGTRYLDHSIRVHEFSNAIVLGRRFGQKSIYDAHADAYHSGFGKRTAPSSVQRVAKALHKGTPGQ